MAQAAIARPPMALDAWDRARIRYGMKMAAAPDPTALALFWAAVGAALKAGFDFFKRREDRKAEGVQWFVDVLREELGGVYDRLDAQAKQIETLWESNLALVGENDQLKDRVAHAETKAESALNERNRMEAQIQALQGEMGEVKALTEGQGQ